MAQTAEAPIGAEFKAEAVDWQPLSMSSDEDFTQGWSEARASLYTLLEQTGIPNVLGQAELPDLAYAAKEGKLDEAKRLAKVGVKGLVASRLKGIGGIYNKEDARRINNIIDGNFMDPDMIAFGAFIEFIQRERFIQSQPGAESLLQGRVTFSQDRSKKTFSVNFYQGKSKTPLTVCIKREGDYGNIAILGDRS